MFDEIIKPVRYIRYRLTRSNLRLGYGVYIDPESKFGKHVQIASGCTIIQSHFQNHISVKAGCEIKHVRLGSWVSVDAHSDLHDCTIGNFSYVSSYCSVSSTSIGKYCSIGPQFICGFGEHPIAFVSTSPVFYSLKNPLGKSYATEQAFSEGSPIDIGNDVWIGARAFIRDGIRVGNGAIIGAGAVVVKDVPPYAIVAGVPAKVLRYRFNPSEIDSLEKLAWWDLDPSTLQTLQQYFQNGNVDKLLEAVQG